MFDLQAYLQTTQNDSHYIYLYLSNNTTKYSSYAENFAPMLYPSNLKTTLAVVFILSILLKVMFRYMYSIEAC